MATYHVYQWPIYNTGLSILLMFPLFTSRLVFLTVMYQKRCNKAETLLSVLFYEDISIMLFCNVVDVLIVLILFLMLRRCAVLGRW